MQQFIDKLISRLEETKRTALDKAKLPIPMPIILSKRSLQELVDMCFEESIRLVGEVAEEYKPFGNSEQVKGGWISCSERLPENDENVLVWFEYFRFGEYNRLYQTYGISHTFRGEWSGFVNGQSGWSQLRVIAWMPLSEPYQKEGE